jgi:hypothetical protein
MNQLNDTYSEEYRHDCELKWLEKLPLQIRREYLVLVEQKRNKQARERLEKGLIERWKNR